MNETNKEKRAMVRVRLSQADAAELSDRAIARELNVSQPFVSGVRRSLSRASGDVLTPEGREDPASAAAVAGPAGPASDDQASAATLAPSTQGAPMYETSAAAMRRFLSDPVADTSDPDPTDPLAPPEGADAASNDAVEAPGIDAIDRRQLLLPVGDNYSCRSTVWPRLRLTNGRLICDGSHVVVLLFSQ